MPLDSNAHRNDTATALIWKLEFAWLPHRCIYNGRWVWLQNAYYASYHSYHSLRGEYNPKPRIVHIWMRKENFVIASLRGTL